MSQELPDDETRFFDRTDLNPGVDQFEQLYDRYFEQLLVAARRRISGNRFRVVDEEDAAQSALVSLFKGLNRGSLQVRSEGELQQLMQRILERKCNRYLERHLSGKRGSGGVRGESCFENLAGDASSPGLEQFVDPNRMPELADQIVRDCDDLLQKLGKPELQETALLKLEGFTREEIASRMNCSVALVKYRTRLIREIWSAMATDDDA